MSRFAMFAALLSSGCLVEQEFGQAADRTLPADHVGPPAVTLVGAGDPTRGGDVELTVTVPSATTSSMAGFVGGTAAGAGSCPPALGGACLGVTGSVRILGARSAASGTATITAHIPLTAPDTLYFQAVVPDPAGIGRVSNVLAVPIVAGILQDGDVCARTPSACDVGLSCCYPCGIPGCQSTCTPTCAPTDPACFGGCYLYP